MKTSLNYQVLLSKVAKNQYKLHNQKQEWKAFIFFVFLIKAVTWAVSIFAGWHFFNQIILRATGNIIFSAVVSALILLAIEGATNLALAKLFKFLYRGTNHLSTTVAMLFVVLLLFGVSFYSSTTGLSMRQARKADNTKEIIEKYSIKADELKKEYKASAHDLDAQIAIIKQNPQGWSHGKRTTLLTWQLDKIDSLLYIKSDNKQQLKNELTKLKQEKNFQLSRNNALMTAEADKYYNIVMAIMIMQFITSGMLMYFFKIIHAEDNPEGQVNEEIKELNEIITANTFYAMKSRMSDLSGAFSAAIINQMPDPEILPLSDYEEPDTDRVKISGFQNSAEKKPDKKPDVSGQKNVQSTGRPGGTEKTGLQKRYIDYLHKHRVIVRSIKALRIPEKTTITNNEVQRIQQLAAGAAHKSRTLVREVYRVAVTVGLNKIDDNGNININTLNYAK